MITASAFDRFFEQLHEVLLRVHMALTKASIEYRLVGGMGVFFHVNERDYNAARLTRDIDIAVSRKDLQQITRIAGDFGFRYDADRYMLVDAKEPKARSAVHLIFINEKVRPDYMEAVPGFSQPTVTEEGLLLAPVVDLVHMKLTSFRLKDKVHLVDMDGVSLITPEIETALAEPLRRRLRQVREEENQSAGAE